MKPHFIIPAALLLSLAVRAEVVGPGRARTIASGFFGGTGVVLRQDTELSKSGDVSPEFYVFDNPSGGWVMVSGEDSLYPILAYSHEGAFHTGTLPPNLSWWMDGIRDAVACARKTGLPAGSDVRKAWNGVPAASKSAGRSVYMETAAWNQDSPYNFFCPQVVEKPEGGLDETVYTALTGCGATAMAILLHCNGYPAKGHGTLPSYSYLSDYRITVDIDGFDIGSHSYKYDLMPLKDEDVRSAGSAAQQQIARLMYDIGVAIKSQFNYSNGTSAISRNIIPALVEHFGYDAAAVDRNRSEYGLGEWIELLKDELDTGHPLLYSGSGNAGGHMFVLAGYDENDLFYVNWGWAGRNNGYFSIRDLQAGEKLAFGQDQIAYTGLVPEQGGQREDVILLYGEGISITSGSPVQGEEFKINVKSFLNDGLNDYQGCVRAALVDRHDRLKSYAGQEAEITLPHGQSGAVTYQNLENYTCKITEPMLFGDGIAMFYRTNLNNWKLCPYNHESGYLTRYGAYDACAIRLPDIILAGDVLAPSIIPGWKAVKKVEWFLDGNPITSGQTGGLMAGAHTVKAVVSFASGETETIIQEIIAE